jgi:hypothetical protein
VYEQRHYLGKASGIDTGETDRTGNLSHASIPNSAEFGAFIYRKP